MRRGRARQQRGSALEPERLERLPYSVRTIADESASRDNPLQVTTLDPVLRLRLEGIRDKFERRFGPESLRRFGARVPGMITSDRVDTQPPLDAAGVARLEQAHGVALPDELLAFVTTIHGGGLGPGHEGLSIPDEPRVRSAKPFPYCVADVARLVDSSVALPPLDPREENEWPPAPGFIELAHHGCGVIDGIVVSGELRGQMWSHDMTWRPLFCGFLDWYEAWLA